MEDPPETPIKEINVKRMFFREGSVCPSMELESGEIKTPYFFFTQQCVRMEWNTDSEYKAKCKEIDKQNELLMKKSKQPKIVGLNGKEIKGN